MNFRKLWSEVFIVEVLTGILTYLIFSYVVSHMLYIIQISNNSYNEGNMSNNSYNEGTMSKIIYANLGVKSSVRTSTIQRAALKLSKVYFDTFKVKYKKLSDFLCMF